MSAATVLDAANLLFLEKEGSSLPKGGMVFCYLKVEVSDELPPCVKGYSRDSYAGKGWNVYRDSAASVRKLIPILHGVTPDGESVSLLVRDFEPFVCFELDRKGTKPAELTDALKRAAPGIKFRAQTTRSKRTWGYDPDEEGNFAERTLVRIKTDSLYNMRALRKEGERLCKRTDRYQLVESKLDPCIMFDEQAGIQPGCWIEATSLTVEDGERYTHSSIEARCSIRSLAKMERDDVPPLLLLSFDIETYSSTGDFPEASNPNDFVCNISLHASWYGVSEEERREHTFLLHVGPSDAVEGSVMLGFDTEKEMLDGFGELLSLSCPQFLLSFNGFGFDYPYLWDRAEMCKAHRFRFGGRCILSEARQHKKTLDSAARGSNDLCVICYSGLNHIDVMKEAQARYSMDSYSLKSCCAKFLKEEETKVDLPYKELFRLVGLRLDPSSYDESDVRAGMKRVLEYAKVDAELPTRLCNAMCCIVSLIEMARVCSTPLEWLVLRGQQCKVYSLLYRVCHELGHHLNNPCVEATDSSFEGASVLEPKAAYYVDPVATLDFASLYPSIMRAENLCFSTYVMPENRKRLKEGTYQEFSLSSGEGGSEERVVTFISKTHYAGILPRILTHLVQARKRAKKEMNEAKDDMSRMIQNQRQLALKVSGNSVYGFCASQFYPCKVISECVTHVGRGMIAKTKELSETYAPDWLSPDFRGEVVYGDTDSVMVRLQGLSLEQAWRWGEELSRIANKEFKEPNELEMEEIKFPFLLIRKKRYVARPWVMHPKEGLVLPSKKLDFKGIEVKRRDNAPCVKTIQEAILNSLFAQSLFGTKEEWKEELRCGRLSSHFSQERVISVLSDKVGEIVSSSLPLDSYTFSKTLRRSYKNENQPHVHVVKLKESRVKGSGDKCGDRVTFFYRERNNEERKRPKSADKLSLRAEDPAFALANGISADREHYLRQVKTAVESVLSVFAQDYVDKVFGQAMETVKTETDQKWLKKSGQTNICSFFTSTATPPSTKRPKL